MGVEQLRATPCESSHCTKKTMDTYLDNQLDVSHIIRLRMLGSKRGVVLQQLALDHLQLIVIVFIR